MPNATTSSPTCFNCGSPLIFVSKKTETFENSKFPTTTTIYRCSNQACQDEKDAQEVKRMKLRDEQAAAKKAREDEKTAQKKNFKNPDFTA